MTAVADLFSGMGGFSLAARMAGCRVVWAGNHWREAVDIHQANHPEAAHACQDLHEQDWSELPHIDLLLASSACQGHTHARGVDRPHHDAARSTADAIIDAIEICRPEAALAENVPEFLKWDRYLEWVARLNRLGYSVSPHLSDAADHGVPQHRVRVMAAITKSRNPIQLRVPHRLHVPASSFIDFDAGNWSPIDKPGRSPRTLQRILAGRFAHGSRFLAPYYGSGSGRTGRSLNRPIGTITTRDRWAVIDGDRMRMLTLDENRAGMGFPVGTILPRTHKLGVHMLGNAVAPMQGRDYIAALRAAV